MDRRKALDGPLPSRVVRTKRAARAARRQAVRRVAGRLGQAGGVDHHGLHPPAAEPVPRPQGRPPGGADHPRRGPHLRHGRAVQGVQDLRRPGPAATSRSTPSCCCPTREAKDGQILEEGITEAGSMASFTAAGTSLRQPGRADGAVLHLLLDVRLPAGGRPHLVGRPTPGPGASCWAPPPAAPRCSARASSTRTATASCWPRRVPTVEAYDPAFAYEMATIVRHGIRRRCWSTSEDVFYYLTLYNENYLMPPMPEGRRGRHHRGPVPLGRGARGPGAPGHDPVLRHRPGRGPGRAGRAGRALGRGRRAVVGHRRTSGCARTRWRPSAGTGCTPPSRPARRWSPSCSGAEGGPVVAVTDFMKAVPDQVARWVPPAVRAARHRRLRPLRHPRAAAPVLRGRQPHVVVATLSALAQQGEVKAETVAEAIARYGIDPERTDPRAFDL